MVEIKINYEGELQCVNTHGPSKSTCVTDAPVDNNGRGLSFSPTDLLATALGSCMATIMGIVADRKDIDLKGSRSANICQTICLEGLLALTFVLRCLCQKTILRERFLRVQR
jgi:organic hydroperoxide reductase OsmC/OhrA